MTIDEEFALAVSHHQAGRLTEAMDLYVKILGQKADHADALNNFGVLARQSGRPDASAELIRRAIAVQSDKAEFHQNLGVSLEDLQQWDEARDAYSRALALRPGDVDALCGLAVCVKEQGGFAEAIAMYRHAVSLDPSRDTVYMSILAAMNYMPEMAPEAIFQEHRKWGKQFEGERAATPTSYSNSPRADRRLRIGYVSGDFRHHSVSFFLLPLLNCHDRQRVEVFCYSNTLRKDSVTDAIRRFVDHWRDIDASSDDAAVQTIRADAIDILVDLSGHTRGNRLGVFARKPAPVQMTYLGYPNTTGLTSIDYRLTDGFADPLGMTEHLNSETLCRLPHCAWCFQPPGNAPDIEVERTGPITFASFNYLSKTNRLLIKLWARVLTAVPGSRLLLKANGKSQVSSRRLTDEFAEEGIGADRVEVCGYVNDPREHLALYNKVDLSLDTHPYNGTKTTCDSLWMGVPVVTMAGASHVSRVGVSLLTSANLPEFIAGSEEEYLNLAVKFAADRDRVRELRKGMRSRLKDSPLLDARRFALDVENAYREMWGKWCVSVNVPR
jgi:predicted O-linked N-acetylglucosamine transferase (SPINDLY family)